MKEGFKCANKEDHNKDSCPDQCPECYDIYREKTESRRLAENIVDNLKNGSGNYLIYPEITDAIDSKIEELISIELDKRKLECLCKEEDKHGHTSINCCNQCGFPIEEFWTNK